MRGCAWRFVSRCVWAADDTTKQWALAIDALKAIPPAQMVAVRAGCLWGDVRKDHF
jgi:hypothetical protein